METMSELKAQYAELIRLQARTTVPANYDRLEKHIDEIERRIESLSHGDVAGMEGRTI